MNEDEQIDVEEDSRLLDEDPIKNAKAVAAKYRRLPHHRIIELNAKMLTDALAAEARGEYTSKKDKALLKLIKKMNGL